MRAAMLTGGFALAASTLGHGFGGGAGNWSGHGPSPGPCLNSTGVETLVNGYTYLLEHPGGPDFNSTAEAILSDEFVVYSDSILTLSGRSVRYLTRGPDISPYFPVFQENSTKADPTNDGTPFHIARSARVPKQGGLYRHAVSDASAASGADARRLCNVQSD